MLSAIFQIVPYNQHQSCYNTVMSKPWPPQPGDWQDVVDAEEAGGSLPAWWTVVSTPGSRSVDIGGQVTVSPDNASADPLSVKNVSDNVVFFVSPEGSVSIDPSDDSASALTISPNGAAKAFTITGAPAVPLTTPDAQDVIDALIALGLIVQHD